MFKNVFSLYTQRHGFHLVDPSAMPLLTSISALTLTTGSVLFLRIVIFSIRILSILKILWESLLRIILGNLIFKKHKTPNKRNYLMKICFFKSYVKKFNLNRRPLKTMTDKITLRLNTCKALKTLKSLQFFNFLSDNRRQISCIFNNGKNKLSIYKKENFIKKLLLLLIFFFKIIFKVNGGSNIKFHQFFSKLIKTSSSDVSKKNDLLSKPKEIAKKKEYFNQKFDKNFEKTKSQILYFTEIFSYLRIKTICYKLIKNKKYLSKLLIKNQLKEKNLKKLHLDLFKQKYNPQKIKEKSSNLYVGNLKDFVVQQLLKESIEKYWKDFFVNRPKKNPHKILRNIYSSWKGVEWFISVNIENFFHIQNQKTLIKILNGDPNFSHPIGWKLDKRTINLLNKIFNAGHFKYDFFGNFESSDTSAKNVNSLIFLLQEIYFQQVDVQINQLENLFDINRGRLKINYKMTNNLIFKNFSLSGWLEKKFSEKYIGLKRKLTKVEKNHVILKVFSARNNPNYKKLFWYRYSNKLLIGVVGNRNDCSLIKDRLLKIFSNVSIKVQDKNIKINSAKFKKTFFLGVFIKRRVKDIILEKNTAPKKIKKLSKQPLKLKRLKFFIPIKYIILQLFLRGYITRCKNSRFFRARYQKKYSNFNEFDIVKKFSILIFDLWNYYNSFGCKNNLWKVIYLLRKSCALTLANKFKLKSAATIYKRFGKNLTIYKNSKIKVKLFYPRLIGRVNYK